MVTQWICFRVYPRTPSIPSHAAEQAGWVYWALRRAVPLFHHSITAPAHVDYLIHFGYTVSVTEDGTSWKVRDKFHRVDGPAIRGENL